MMAYTTRQMEGVMQRWQMVPSEQWKIPAWQDRWYGAPVGQALTRLMQPAGGGFK